MMREKREKGKGENILTDEEGEEGEGKGENILTDEEGEQGEGEGRE